MLLPVRTLTLLSLEDFKLKPGLLMQIKLQRRPRQAFVVPEEALLVKGTQKYVYTISLASESNGNTDKGLDNKTDQDKTGVVKRTVVETGGRRKGYVEITNGLNSSDQVVIHGTLKIRDGAKVKIAAVESENDSLNDLLQQVSTAGN